VCTGVSINKQSTVENPDSINKIKILVETSPKKYFQKYTDVEILKFNFPCLNRGRISLLITSSKIYMWTMASIKRHKVKLSYKQQSTITEN
jgi:hypothetical protein